MSDGKGHGAGIAIVAGGIRFKMRSTRQVVACFFGDGAVAEGGFHEGLNMAAIWELPVLFVRENNQYGASTRVDLVMRNTKTSDRADVEEAELNALREDVLARIESAVEQVRQAPPLPKGELTTDVFA